MLGSKRKIQKEIHTMLVVTKTTHAMANLGVVTPLKQPCSTQSSVPLNNSRQYFSAWSVE